jgi:hypothetical protein
MDVVRFEVLSWYLLCGAHESHKIPQTLYPVSSKKISVCVRQHATTFTLESWPTVYVQHRSSENNQQNSSHMASALRSGSPWNIAVHFKGWRQIVSSAQYGETFEAASTLYPFSVLLHSSYSVRMQILCVRLLLISSVYFKWYNAMKQQFVATHTIRQTEIPAQQKHVVYQHIFSHNTVSKKKNFLLIFS